MAIYRAGQASMDAQGYITGYDTKWREQLTLIRPGATIFFIDAPFQAAVISEVISDTQIRAITTGGAEIGRSNYIILLHDSITVDGLAQDVAETLRYYQSKETQIEEVIDFFKNFDLQGLKDLANQVKNDAEKTASDRAATEQLRNETNQIKADTDSIKTQTQQIKDSATAEINLARDQGVSLINQTKDQAVTDINQIKNETSNIRDEAKNALSGAESARDSAIGYANDANNAKSGAETARDQAQQWVQQVNPENMLHKNMNLSDLLDKDESRNNIGLGGSDYVGFKGVTVSNSGQIGGVLSSRIVNNEGVASSEIAVHNEYQDEKSKATIKVSNNERSKNSFLQFDEDGVLSGATEIKASNKIKIRGGGGSPKISITNDVINQSTIGSNMSIELNDDGTIRFYRRANDGNGEYQRIELPKLDGVPNAETSVALKGGLLWDPPNEVYLGNFNDITQGWSYVAGTPANRPVQGDTYGSCFTYCSQGLRFGNAPGDYNPNDIWFRQIYHTTGNTTYSRVNTNKGAWDNWAEYTMSSVSDERLKNILGNLNVNGALDNINRMEFKLFRFKEERDKAKQPTVRRGVISQQIRKIDKEYTKCIGGFYHLDRTPLLLDGLAAIQALSRKDIENKERISKLEKEVEELKAAVSVLLNKPTTLES